MPTSNFSVEEIEKAMEIDSVDVVQHNYNLFDRSVENSPCYQCLYPQENTMGETNLNCSENGVISPLVGVIGTTQAMEAIKVITGIGQGLVGKVAYYDAKQNEWQKFSLAKSANCPICST